MSAEIFVGLDVSQACVDVVVHPGTAFQIAHDERGIAEAVERLHALHPTLIVLEATGGLEVTLTGALAAAGKGGDQADTPPPEAEEIQGDVTVKR